MPRVVLLEQINVLRHQVFVVLNSHKSSLFQYAVRLGLHGCHSNVRLGRSRSARLIKENLRNQYSQNWLETKNIYIYSTASKVLGLKLKASLISH